MVVVILALLGGVIGGALLSDFGGFVFGLVIGGVVGWVADLARRVRKLEQRLEARTVAEARRATDTPAPERAREREQPPAVETPPVQRPAPAPREPAQPPLPQREPAAARPDAAEAARRTRRAALENLEPSAFDALLARVWRWFTTGNVPVKVGVVLSLFGVAFLINEGINRQWLVLPIEFRLMGVALFGIGLLVLGWRLREKN